MDLKSIREALAAQIQTGVSDDTTVYAYPINDPHPPYIAIYPGRNNYIDYFSTFGPNGIADLFLRIKVQAGGDPQSMGIQLDRYLGIGTGNNSSIADAVNAGPTLAGTVDRCVVLTAEAGDPDSDPGAGYLDVHILVSKQNAEVG